MRRASLFRTLLLAAVCVAGSASSAAGAAAVQAQGPGGRAQQGPAPDLSDGPIVIRQTELDREVKRVASQIRCVVCRGQSIQESPSDLAQEMRGVVREQLALGKTEDEVKQYFVERYGKQVLLQPEARGFNLVVYVLPVLVLLGGAAFVYSKAKRLTQREPAELDARANAADADAGVPAP